VDTAMLSQNSQSDQAINRIITNNGADYHELDQQTWTMHPVKNLVSVKGRGALSNVQSRFIPLKTVTQEHKSACQTEVIEQEAKTILSKNDSPDVPHALSVNPYAGCEHGCIYCYARPTHSYHELSPGIDFETKIIAKVNAVELLAEEIAKPNYQCKPILIGANTDPYQPIEKDYQLTRRLLEQCLEANQPVSIITKSSLILRDLDILKQLANKGLCSVNISITTLDNSVKRKLEPRAASGQTRLTVIKALSDASVPVGVIVAPVIPAINDKELEAILTESAQHGAHSATYILLRLPREVKDIFVEWIQHYYPQKAKHVLSLIAQTRGGKLYDSNFHNRMSGQGVFSDMIAQRFKLVCNRLGLVMDKKEKLNCQLFHPGRSQGQMSLF
jgi:DNA repair photolyase